MTIVHIAIGVCFIVKIYLHLYLERTNETDTANRSKNEFYFFEYLWFYTMPVHAEIRTQKILCNLAYACFVLLVLVEALFIWVF